MQHQLLQGAVQVVGLGKAIAGGRLVDNTMLDFAVYPGEGTTTKSQTNGMPQGNFLNKAIIMGGHGEWVQSPQAAVNYEWHFYWSSDTHKG